MRVAFWSKYITRNIQLTFDFYYSRSETLKLTCGRGLSLTGDSKSGGSQLELRDREPSQVISRDQLHVKVIKVTTKPPTVHFSSPI